MGGGPSRGNSSNARTSQEARGSRPERTRTPSGSTKQRLSSFRRVSRPTEARTMQSREQAEEVLGATDPLPCGDWRWPGRRQQMRHRGDSLAMVCDDGDYWWLMLGGPDEASLEWTSRLSLTWDESDSRRDQ